MSKETKEDQLVVKLPNGIPIYENNEGLVYAVARDGYKTQPFKLKELNDYCSGTKAQQAFSMSPDDREVIISGISPEIWDQMFEEE